MVKKLSAFLGLPADRQQFLRPHHDSPRPVQMVLVRWGDGSQYRPFRADTGG
jgi:hypothetical protein